MRLTGICIMHRFERKEYKSLMGYHDLSIKISYAEFKKLIFRQLPCFLYSANQNIRLQML